jgi:hypothetical protein
MIAQMPSQLAAAVDAQRVQSFQAAWARVRLKNAERRASRQRFQDAEYELARVTLEEVKSLSLHEPTCDIAEEILCSLKRLDHPSVGLLPVLEGSRLALVTKFSTRAVRWAVRGDRTLGRDWRMNDLPFGGLTTDGLRVVRYKYRAKGSKTGRKRSSTTRDGQDYCYSHSTKQAARGDMPTGARARKLLLLQRVGYRCPLCPPGSPVLLELRAWVVGKAVKDARLKKPVCRSCWVRWRAAQAPMQTAHAPTSKDPRIPNDTARCPRCDRLIVAGSRAHWRISSEPSPVTGLGYAVCLWCRRKEPKGSKPVIVGSPPAPKRVKEARRAREERAWRKSYCMKLKYTCPVCNTGPYEDLREWEFAERLQKGYAPCCKRCHGRWRRAHGSLDDIIQGDYIRP